jgi:hypothetical protein
MVIAMHNKKGFSLLSFLLYLMLFSLITLLLCHIIVSLIIPSLSSIRTCQSVVTLHIATDLFVRDVRAGIDTWKVIKPDELIWQTDDSDVGWSLSDNRLVRNTGLYSNQEWKNKTSSIVAVGIDKIIFRPEKAHNQIVGIGLELIPIAAHKKPIICFVAVKRKK